MKAIILAAGKGVRLGHTGDKLPKPLTQLSNGKSILEHQIDILLHHFEPRDIFIVVGYHKEEIIKRFPNQNHVVNQEYASENTAKSLLKALESIDDDVLWTNGDVVFHSNVIQKIIDSKCSSMVVNESEVAEEEIKYRTNEKGRIVEVSKQVKNGQGEALGVNLFLKEDLPTLKTNLKKCNPNDYFEKGIEYCLRDGTEVSCTVVRKDECAEIDFQSDLEHVNNMIKHW